MALNRNILGVKKNIVFDSVENRLFKHYLKQLSDILEKRNLIDLFEKDKEKNDILLSKIKAWLRTDEANSISPLGIFAPNNVLLSDRRYRKIYDSWVSLKNLNKVIENDIKNLEENFLKMLFWTFVSKLSKYENIRIAQNPIGLNFDEFKLDYIDENTKFFAVIYDENEIFKLEIIKREKCIEFVYKKANNQKIAEAYLDFASLQSEGLGFDIKKINDFVDRYIADYISSSLKLSSYEVQETSPNSSVYILDIFSSKINYSFAGKKYLSKNYNLVQSWDFPKAKRIIDCSENALISLGKNVKNFSMYSLFNSQLDISNKDRLDAAKILLDKAGLPAKAESCIYPIPDSLDEMSSFGIDKILANNFASKTAVPLSIAAIFAKLHLGDFNAKKTIIKFVLSFENEAFILTPIKLDYNKNRELKMPKTKGYSFIKYPSKIVVTKEDTPQATMHFINWLKSKLAEKNVKVEIECISVPLKKLNDSDAIYAASLDALSSLQTRKDIENISLFISPGTPLMAFSWTMASLCIKEIPVEIISSSSVKGGLEHIDLPQKLPNISLQQLNLEKPSEFDVVIHLFGEQPYPSVFAINQFKAKQHIFLTSPEYVENVSFLDTLYDNSKNKIILEVDPFSPADVKDKLLNLIAKNNWAKVGFNLTGGTKLMYEGAMLACKSTNGIPFYFEAKTHSLIWLNSFASESIVGIGNIENYFIARGYEVSNSGHWTESMEKRRNVTEFLIKNKSKITKFYRDILYETNDGKNLFKSYDVFKGKNNVSFNGRDGNITIGYESINLPDCEDFTKYITGSWFEEYIYLKLLPALQGGLISDLRTGLEVRSRNSTIQEFDILFKYNEKLYIIETKSGAYKREHLTKLRYNVGRYAGVTGKGFLVTTFPVFGDKTIATFKEVLAKDTRISHIAGNDIYNLIDLILKA